MNTFSPVVTQDNLLAIIGCGRVGSTLAVELARAGYDVMIYARNKPAANDRILALLKKLDGLGLDPKKIEAIAQRVHWINSYATIEFAKPCGVFECVSEELMAKAEVINALLALDYQGWIGYTSSTIARHELVPLLPKREDSARIVWTHFFNPIGRTTIAEIEYDVAATFTTKGSVATVLKRIGKDNIEGVEAPGVVNKLLAAMFAAALDIAENAIDPDATLRAIDAAMERGANHPMGPFRLMDYIGLDIVARMIEPTPMLSVLVDAGKLGRKTKGGFYAYP